jgi:two-component system chemotaxis response regulator CheY
MNGLEFIKTVRAKPAYKSMRIVMVTTEVEMEHVELALKAGANEYVMKPFTTDGLREKIELLGIGKAAA